jgi:hypothetical protein
MPSRRHSRQTGPIYLAKLLLLLPSQVQFTVMATFVLLAKPVDGDWWMVASGFD